ncbi:lachrymatory-factor synthase [Pyrus ussuriensis x Pyrus communis]|uniref:Lachrymatory-factor synthase n=1 Tax=Pyrus ussuriensis x Pyrus communis TaxID=2448454 RepID=A0A5N5H834_9ROSA|nr:lachrymatory-factor synthase [Pyrus ussuriensis x Pyrus communis]
MIDPINHCLSYEINENNIGFMSYVATMQLEPINGEEGGTGSRIEWLFVSDPVEGWKYEDLQVVYETYLELITKNMKNALLARDLESFTNLGFGNNYTLMSWHQNSTKQCHRCKAESPFDGDFVRQNMEKLTHRRGWVPDYAAKTNPGMRGMEIGVGRSTNLGRGVAVWAGRGVGGP